jgi:hypothetical protein
VDPLPDVVHLFFDEFPRLSRGGFTLTFVGACERESLLFGHKAPSSTTNYCEAERGAREALADAAHG